MTNRCVGGEKGKFMNIHGGRAYTYAWISGLLNGCDAQVQQCLNDIETMGAWDGAAVHGIITDVTITLWGTGPARRVYHVSAGKLKGNQKCSLFFVNEGNQAYIAGVYQHSGPSSYDKVFSRSGELPNTIHL